MKYSTLYYTTVNRFEIIADTTTIAVIVACDRKTAIDLKSFIRLVNKYDLGKKTMIEIATRMTEINNG